MTSNQVNKFKKWADNSSILVKIVKKRADNYLLPYKQFREEGR